MTHITDWIDRNFYSDFRRNWDDELFRKRIVSVLSSEHVLLDVGAGAGIVEQMNFKGIAARVCGIDVDPRVVENPMLNEGKICNASTIPYSDDMFDVVIADNVLEHLDHPLIVFREIARVLKPGGKFLFKTPNRWHYVPMCARLTPLSFHRWFNARRGRRTEDTFPTVYRANDQATVCRLAEAAGLKVDRLEFIEGRPEYMRMTWPTYALGLLFERIVNSTPRLSSLRVLFVGELSKSK